MITLGIDSNNDLYVDTQGNIGIKKDLEAMGDIYVNKIQTNRGELVYDEGKGVDYFNTIFTDILYPDILQNQIISELEDTEKTQKVSAYTQEIKDNVYSYTVNCLTDYGELEING